MVPEGEQYVWYSSQPFDMDKAHRWSNSIFSDVYLVLSYDKLYIML